MALLQIHEPGQTPDPHEEAAEQAVGIDLGTTHSLIGLQEGDGVRLFANAAGQVLHPSVVAYPESGGVVVGQAAQDLREALPLASIKRLIGKRAADFSDATALPFILANAGEDALPKVHTPQGEKTAIAVSADVLRHLKKIAEANLGRAVTRAVITVPAYFDETARQATKQAAHLAGLEVLRLVSEPTAAALAYGLDQGKEGLYAVYDLGGGTFDFSLLKLQGGVFQVLATQGNTSLGGDDFDHALVDSFLAHVSYTDPLPPEKQQELLALARSAKEKLSHQDGADIAVALPGRDAAHRFMRADFEQLIAQAVASTLDACAQALQEAGLEATEVQGVILAGGSTRIPYVHQQVAAFFGQEPYSDVDPDQVVAQGAALQAGALSGLGDSLLLDVCPLSLGLETMGGLVEKLIYRNTPIPVAKAQEFTTYQDGQTAMSIHVLQGERERVEDVRSLGRFTLRGIPPLPAGAARILITFALDADGLLTVSAQEQETGVRQVVEVKPTYGIDTQEMTQMLYDSLQHAQEDMQQRLLVEARVDAERTIAALETALVKDQEFLTPEDYAAIDPALQAAKAQLGTQNRDALVAAIENLEKACHPFVERRMNSALAGAMRGKAISAFED